MEYLHEPDIEFPEFERTPLELRELISSCTPGWTMVVKGLQREAFKLKIQGPSDGLLDEENALAAIIKMWHKELDRAKYFLANRRAETNNENVSDDYMMLDRILCKLQTMYL